jgi:hypothetical protein
MSVDGVYSCPAPPRPDPARNPAAVPAPTAAPPSQAELEKAADRVVKAGDDQARVQALARELEDLDDEASRATLMAMVAERANLSTGMPSEWFNPQTIGEAAASGAITREQEGLIAKSFAAAYNRGLCDPNADPPTVIDHVAATTFLDADTPFGAYYDNVNRINDFLNSGRGAEMDAFVANYAQRELTLLAIHGENSWSPQRLERVMHLLDGAGDPKMVVEVFDRIGPEARQKIYELMRHTYQPDSGDAPLVRGWSRDSDDPMAILLRAVASQPGQGQSLYLPGVPFAVGKESSVTTADKLALELVRFAGQHEDEFFNGQDVYGARASAMADLFLSHSKFLLDSLSDPRFGQFTPGSSQYTPQALRDVMALGTLLRMTMLSDEVPEWKRELVQGTVLGYARGLIAGGPGPDAAPSPTGRVGMLMLAMHDAVKQGYASLEDQRAAQERVVGFFTDILVDQLAKGGGKLTPQGVLAEIVGGAVIDTATDKGKAFLKDKITDFLFGGFDTQELDELQGRINLLVGGFVQSLPDGQEIDIGNFLNAMSGAIDDVR